MKMTIIRTPKEEIIKYGDLIEIEEDIGIFHSHTDDYLLKFYSLKHKNIVIQCHVESKDIKKFYGEIILKNE